MTEDPAKQHRLIETQAERWTTEAKKLMESGKAEEALENYRRAADELPGAPWLQQRTAELSRKLKKSDVAIVYFRRAGTAFQIAGFAKRAVAPLRTAWTLAVENLPGTSRALVDVAVELVQLHRRLGSSADAAVTFERTNATLRARGFSELPSHVLEAPLRNGAVAPPSSRAPSSSPDAAPASEMTLRSPSAAAEAPPSSVRSSAPATTARHG